MKIRFCSDVHLEVNYQYLVPDFLKGDSEEIMVFAGDTLPTKYLQKKRNDSEARSLKKKFHDLLDITSDFAERYFILGNHEHYGGNFEETAQFYRDFFDDNGYDNCHVLDNDTIKIGDAWVFGATLWTNMGNNDPLSHWNVGRGMNDFRIIGFDGRRFATTDAVDQFNRTMAILTAQLDAHPNERFVVFTHHCPSYKSNGSDHAGSTIIDGYCSNLEQFILDHPQITNWVSGHTHFNCEYEIGSCKIETFMRGYVAYDRSASEFRSDVYLQKFIEV